MATVDILTPNDVEQIVERVLARRERVEEWLNAREAANYLKLHERTIRRFAQEGRIPSHRIGGSVRFALSDLQNHA